MPYSVGDNLDTVSARRQRSWTSLLVSAALHALLIAVALGIWRRDKPEREDPNRPSPSADATREVSTVYLSPVPARRKPPPPPRAAAPIRPSPPQVTRDTRPPSKVKRAPEPAPQREQEAARGGDPAAENVPAPPEAPAPAAEKATREVRKESELATRTGRPATDAAAAAAPTIESEARRLFGPRNAPAVGTGKGPLQSPAFESLLTEGESNCVPVQRPPRDPNTPPELGTVVGRILRRDNGQPLSGALLRMIGTPYVAYTDNDGKYRFVFDLALVQDCRTQLVYVMAPGYETERLTLVVGRQTMSDDVLLRRR